MSILLAVETLLCACIYSPYCKTVSKVPENNLKSPPPIESLLKAKVSKTAPPELNFAILTL
jgi:hypothetical protein